MTVTKNRLISNASWIIACKTAQSLVALLIGTISARYLGPSGYGLISYAASMVAFMTPLAQLGLRNVLVEQIVASPEREGETVGTALVMSTTASIFCVMGCIAFSMIANANERDTFLVCLLYSISLIFQMTEMTEYWYQAKLLSKYTSVISLIAYTVVSIYKVFLLVTEKSVFWFAAANALDHLLISAGSIILYRHLGAKRLTFSFSMARTLFSKSRHYIVSGMMVAVFSQTDKIMLKMMIGNAQTGYYSTAATCAVLSGFVFLAVIDTTRPIIFEKKKADRLEFEKSVSRLFSIIIYMGLAQGVVFTLLAKWIVMILYGEAYAQAAPVLQVLIWSSAFAYIGTVRNIWLLAESKQKYLWLVNLSGALLNIAGNLLLIPSFGAAGAAFASLATQCFTNFALCFIIRPIRPITKLIWRSFDPRVIFEKFSEKEQV